MWNLVSSEMFILEAILWRSSPALGVCMWSMLTRTVRRPGSTPGQGRSYPADVVPLQNWTCYWSKLYAGWETACCGGTTHSIVWLNRTWRPIVWKKFLSFLHSAGEVEVSIIIWYRWQIILYRCFCHYSATKTLCREVQDLRDYLDPGGGLAVGSLLFRINWAGIATGDGKVGEV